MWSPYDKDHNTLGSVLEPPAYRNPHIILRYIRLFEVFDPESPDILPLRNFGLKNHIGSGSWNIYSMMVLYLDPLDDTGSIRNMRP